MIRIMHVVHSLHEGGVERLLLDICSKIDRNRFDIQVCCIAEEGSLYDTFKERGIKVHFLDGRRDFSIRNLFLNIHRTIKLAMLLRREKIDITHGHEFFSTVFSRLSSLLARVGIRNITLHNEYTWWGKKTHFTQRILSYVTTAVVCNSQSTYQYSLEKDRIRKDKYFVIPNGIDTDRFTKKRITIENWAEDTGIDTKKFICVNVANISPRKGQKYIVEAANILKAEFPDMIYLLIGAKHHLESVEYDLIESLISKYGLENTVFLSGREMNVEMLLDKCNLYLMPSVVEGFGLALAEAMSMECICIASDIAPFKEIMDDGEEGFFFKSEDGKALAQKIRYVRTLGSEELKHIRENARRKIVEKFDLKEMVKQYENLYYSEYIKLQGL